MSQNCFWFCTCFLAKKQCAQARQKFWIRWGNSAGILGTRFAHPAFLLQKNLWVLFWCLYCTKLAPIFKTKWGNDFARSACVVAWNCPVRSGKAPRTGEYASNPERKNTPCISDFARARFFLKKERVFFFRGSTLQVFGQCVGLQYGRSFGKTIFWGKDLPKLRLICFWILMSQMEKEGFGEEFSICSAVFFWRNLGKRLST